MELRNGNLAAIVEPDAGGRIGQFFVGGQPCLFGNRERGPIYWGSPPMVPWAGRVANAVMDLGTRSIALEPLMPPHAIHGVGLHQAWEVTTASATAAELSCVLDWELGGSAGQRFTLSAETLRCELWVTADSEPMPVTIGWHPWFTRPASLDAEFTAMYERGPDHLPTGALVRPGPLPWDDCFVLAERPPVVHLAHAGIELTTDCSHWVVYTEQAHAICVEPQSGPPNAVNLGLAHWLQPGETLHRWMQWRVTRGL